MSEHSPTDLSDSELSLQLSDASTLSSDSNHSDVQFDSSDEEHHGAQTLSTTPKRSTTPKKTLISGKAQPKKTAKKSSFTLNKKKQTKQTQRQASENVEKEDVYCLCRKGYDGKEFMIACDQCQEWFHGRCVGISPKSVTEHYFCEQCTKAKAPKQQPVSEPPKGKAPTKGRGKKGIMTSAKKQAIPRKKTAKTVEIPKPVVQVQSDNDEDLDDICPVCDSECTCGASFDIESIAAIKITEDPKDDKKLAGSGKQNIPVWQSRQDVDEDDEKTKHPAKVVERYDPDFDDSKPAPKTKKPKKPKTNSSKQRKKSTTTRPSSVKSKPAPKPPKKTIIMDSDSDDEVVVDDIDDLLDDLSPLSDHTSDESDQEDYLSDTVLHINSPYPDSRTGSYTSSIHLDSGDDENIEEEEERAIIEEMDYEEDNSDFEEIDRISDDEDLLDSDDHYHIEEDDHMENYYVGNSGRWSSSEEEDEEYDYNDTRIQSEAEMADYSEDEEMYGHEQLIPLVDEHSHLFDSIAAAFMQVLAPLANMPLENNLHNNNEPVNDALQADFNFSAFDLANALAATSEAIARSEEHQDNPHILKDMHTSMAVPEGSIPTHKATMDELAATDALSALSVLAAEASLSMPLEIKDKDNPNTTTISLPTTPNTPASEHICPSSPETIDAQPDLSSLLPLPTEFPMSLPSQIKLQDQLLELFKLTSSSDLISTAGPVSSTLASSSSMPLPLLSIPNSLALCKKSLAYSTPNSRQILPKPTTNNNLANPNINHQTTGVSNLGSPVGYNLTLTDQQLMDVLHPESADAVKRRNIAEASSTGKKRRISNAKLGVGVDTPHTVDDTPSPNSNSLPDSEPIPVLMDELVDTSQLYTRSSSRSPSPDPEVDSQFSRDLSRWQRVPIGAFRLMRAKNRLWLER